MRVRVAILVGALAFAAFMAILGLSIEFGEYFILHRQ